MNGEPAKVSRLELLLAGLLEYGTWLASAVIAVGLALTLVHSASGMRVVNGGIGLLILLPVSRVMAMLTVFVRLRDYRFAAIAAMVLLIILLGFAAGMFLSKTAE